jgi:RHS repeat-associated protein
MFESAARISRPGATWHVRDANGNLKDDGTNLYDYDYRNQLVRIRRKSDLAVIGTYDYDGICRRIGKSTSAGATSFYWIGFELAIEYDASGLVSRRHRGAAFNEVVSAYQRDIADLDQDGSTTDYIPLTPMYDGAHDCAAVLDHTGAIAESYVHTYDGAVTITNAGGGTIATSAVGWHQGYGNTYRDPESGLLYAIHRYYQPSVGRFITEDPARRWFDVCNLGNGYAWVANHFRNGHDPLGLKGTFHDFAVLMAKLDNNEANWVWYEVYYFYALRSYARLQARLTQIRNDMLCARERAKELWEQTWGEYVDIVGKWDDIVGLLGPGGKNPGTIGVESLSAKAKNEKIAAENKIAEEAQKAIDEANQEYKEDLQAAHDLADEMNGQAVSEHYGPLSDAGQAALDRLDRPR